MKIQENSLNTPFIKKLNSILEDPANIEIITWDETRTLIDILDEKRIQTEILPKFFRHAKFESFIRQLNLYGFKKIKNKNCQRFKHPHLIEGNSLFSIKPQRKFKNSLINPSQKQNSQNPLSQQAYNHSSIAQKSEQKQSYENGKTKKTQTSSLIETQPMNFYSSTINYQPVYDCSYFNNPLNYSCLVNRLPSYGFQAVLMPNLNNILFYN